MHNSKCSGAMVLITFRIFFLFTAKIAKPKSFKLREAIVFLGNVINCFFNDKFTKFIKFLSLVINIIVLTSCSA